MKFLVPEEVLKKTTKCLNNFSCLSSGQCNDPACNIEYAAGENIIFVRSSDDAGRCPYRIAFGYGNVCRCPVHFALYQQKSCGGKDAPLPAQTLRNKAR